MTPRRAPRHSPPTLRNSSRLECPPSQRPRSLPRASRASPCRLALNHDERRLISPSPPRTPPSHREARPERASSTPLARLDASHTMNPEFASPCTPARRVHRRRARASPLASFPTAPASRDATPSTTTTTQSAGQNQNQSVEKVRARHHIATRRRRRG